MLDLPKTTVDDLIAFADWAEASTLLNDKGTLAASEITAAIGGAGLLGTSRSEVFLDEDTPMRDPDDFSEDDEISEFVVEILGHLQDRSVALKGNYPFTISGDLIQRNFSCAADTPSYSLMVIIALLAKYDPAVSLSKVEGEEGFQQLFEKVVQASELQLFGKQSSRFGWPREPHFPSGFPERLGVFGDEMSLLVSRPEAWDGTIGGNDVGLDIATRVDFGDGGSGTLVILTQCATGRHWKSKTSEPPDAIWNRLMHWDALRARAIAVPWWFPDSKEFEKIHLAFNHAIVLDRRRIMYGDPDKRLPPPIRDAIVAWIDAQAFQLPPL